MNIWTANRQIKLFMTQVITRSEQSSCQM